MTIEKFLRLLGSNAAKAEEYLQNPKCTVDIKKIYLNDFDAPTKNKTVFRQARRRIFEK